MKTKSTSAVAYANVSGAATADVGLGVGGGDSSVVISIAAAINPVAIKRRNKSSDVTSVGVIMQSRLVGDWLVLSRLSAR